MKTNKISKLVLVLGLGASFALAGCNSHTDKLSDLVSDPGKYVNHDVTVAGEVTKVYELPLGIGDVSAYRINDGSGQVWILSHAGAPREGDKVGLKGTFRQAGNISGFSFGNVIDEKERRMH